MVTPDKWRYLNSMAIELHSQSTRVRDLIGPVHWLSDGSHKECLLRNLITRFLAAGMIAGRGFVIDPNRPESCSREQDILVVDTSKEPPVFNEGGLLITFPRNVVAAVSVKTKLGTAELGDAVRGLNSLRTVIRLSGIFDSVWCGSYHFELDETVANNSQAPYKYCTEAIRSFSPPRPPLDHEHSMPLGPNLVCSAQDLAFKLSYRQAQPGNQQTSVRIRGFACHGLATAVFIADLLDHIAVYRGLTDADFARFADHSSLEPLAEEEATMDVEFAV